VESNKKMPGKVGNAKKEKIAVQTEKLQLSKHTEMLRKMNF